MSSMRLRNWRRAIAVLSVLALILLYAPVISTAATVTVYHETFETGKGVVVQSGGASLTQVTGKVFEGNSDSAALYVSNRANDWDAADFRFADIGLENGKTYTITVKGYIDPDVTVPADAQAYLQCVNSYTWLAGANYAAGSTFTLTGTYTVDTSKDTSIRVQSNGAGATVPFYIGDILIAGEGSTPTGHTDPTNTIANNNIPVVLYHRVVDNPSNEWTDTSVANFKSHMDYLQENGYNTLSADEYVKILKGEATAPAKPILLTFDDATSDFISTVLPILEQNNMKCVLFVVSDWIGGGYSITQAQLQDIAENHPNVSIESHSKTHDQTTWSTSISYETALAELTAAKTYINGITGKDPVLLAYPYGNSSVDARAAAADTGIQYAFKVGYPNTGAYNMGRYYTLNITVADFAASIRGPAPKVTVYHETFASGKGAAAQSGGASLTPVTGKAFEGNDDGAALYVSNRANNWDAVDFAFTDIGLENGKTYTITVKGYVDSDVTIPEGAQAFLQCVDSYAWLAGAGLTAGSAFTLTGTYTVDTSKDRAVRVQSNDAGATVPFYIGDILITGEGSVTPPPSVTVVYHESFADGKGVAVQSGGASLTPVTGKTFEGNDDGAALYVSNRANNWDAVDFKFADMGLTNGKTYTIKVAGYVDADVIVTTGAGAALQTDKTYAWLAGTDFIAGQAFVLTREYTADTTTDTAIRVQSNEAGKAVPFYIGDILITEKASSGDDGEPRPPALPFTTVTFEDQTAGGFVARGGNEILTVTNEDNHTDGGGYCLKVEGRTSTWNGPSLRVEKYIDQGSEYKVTAWVKTITPSSVQLQLSTQVGNGSGANYVNLQGKTISTADGWAKYEGTYRYNNLSSEYVTLYVESSNNATASFYIDDISFVSTGSGPIEIQKDLVPIKDAYQNDFLIGNAISVEDLQGIRLELLKMHHNVATAGNAMKPGSLQATKGNFDFSGADAIVDKVLAEGMQMHGHVLVWHQQTGAWMNTTTDASGTAIALGREEALENMRTHIRTVMEHFGDKVISWDVVNEAMNDNPPNPSDWRASLRRSTWFNAIGDDYVEQAFLAAREVLDEHPEWKPITLYYNDYNEDNQNKSKAIYNMVKELNDKYALTHPGKLLIDGLGMQGHYTVSTNPANVQLTLDRFISLGVRVSITELDIQAGSNYTLPENLAKAQGYLYAQLMKIFRDHAADIDRVTFWGMDDGTSWRSATNPLLFDKNLQAKPAYYGVIDPDKFMAENAPETPADANQSTAEYGTPAIDGSVDAVWSDTAAMPISRYQMAWQGANGTAKALWDENNLYVLVQVSNAELDKTSANAWEQDSVEAFVDENNGKTSFYQEDDGQYRINFDNQTSFNPASIAAGFESATSISGTNYTVEMKIPFKTITPANEVKIGFDAQINDGKDGARQSAATWNDTTGNAYQDTSVYGVLTLTGYDPDIAIVDAAVTAIEGGTYQIPFASQTSQDTKNAWVQAAANALIPEGNGSTAAVAYDGGYVVTVTKGTVTHTAAITVTEQPSPVNTLKSLSLSAGTLKPAFNGNTLSYCANVPNSIANISFTPVLDDARASVTVNGNAVVSGQKSQDISLKVGKNIIKVIVTAQDGTPRTYTVTVNRLLYDFKGFLPPIKSDGSGTFQAGSTIPVKFQLKDTAGHSYPLAIAKVYVAKVTNGTPGVEKAAKPSGRKFLGNLCIYNLFTKQYEFNWSTKGYTAGTYRIRVDLGDGLTYTVNVNLKDNSHHGH